MHQLLTGTTVLDLGRMLAGDFGSMLLGDMGADVIKIEEPKGGDPLRAMAPHFLAGESAYFLSINRNKRSLALDMTKAKGKAIFHELLKKADVVFDNFRPGILERLGADYETIRKVNPRIISCSISSYGATGPFKEMPGFDLVLQALSGSMSITGEPGRNPVRMGIPMGDLAGAMFAAQSIAAALYRREKTGEGCRIDISLLDSLVALLTYVAEYYFVGKELAGPSGSGHMSVVPYRAYKTKDGYLTIAVFVEKFWEKLCAVIGRPECGKDPRFATQPARLENRKEVDSMLEAAFATRTTDDWMAFLYKEGVPAAPVLTIDKVFEHPQIVARDMLVEINHAKCGRFKMIGNPLKLCSPGTAGHSETRELKPPLKPPPVLGEHTDEILSQFLGYSRNEIEALRREDVV
jgi:crotonobetainyl-CoA:carnitine CoA-transferase CaiB-like acyl-CoA transferase